MGTQRAPTFQGETKGKWCKTHVPSNTVDMVNKQCAHAGCTSQANFNLEG